jgi:hypothetical protein
MNKIYKLEAAFEDFESIWYKTIGIFADKGVADDTKEKWEKFFQMNSSLLDEPEGWVPELDEWYDPDIYDKVGGSVEDFSWGDSHAYYSLLSKYESIRNFYKITIEELYIDSELFIDKFEAPMIDLMIQFDRDWKLKKIMK